MFTDDIILWLEHNGYTHTINASSTRDGYLPRESTIEYMELPLYDVSSFNIQPWLEPVAKQLDRVYARYISEIRFQKGNGYNRNGNSNGNGSRIGQTTKVLVHCQAGISRSVTLVLYWLMTRKGMTFNDAFEYIKTRRNIANPNSGFVKILTQIHG